MKAKSKKAAQKRFKKTKNGKILRMRQMNGHLKAGKSRTARNRYKSPAQVSAVENKVISKLMPYN
ncbi:MAG TPA: 50S ribosomal protein L35 [Candidatus Saccharimonadales bacterium]|nr:50S ribosomal protein L35 [Candidatus Saccharimonadales bacterium]